MIYLNLFLAFAKIGLFTIGGGYAMIPLMQQELVGVKAWLTLQQLTDFIGVAQATPGPFAVNTATFVGLETAGIPGAFCATLGVITPSVIIILLIAHFFLKAQDNKWVRAILYGMSAAVIGLIAASVYILAENAFFSKGITMPDIKGLVICAIIAVLCFWKKVHPILLIVISAGLGLILYGVF